MRKLTIVTVAGLVLLTAAPQASAQGAASVLLRIAGMLTAGSVLESEIDAASADAVDAEPASPLMFVHSVTRADSPDVIALPSGSIVPTYPECPTGWETHVDSKGQPLFFQFGLVDENGNTLPDALDYRLSACVKP